MPGVGEDGQPAPVWAEDLIDIAEASASCPVYPLLKRPDERHVTMRAYDHPAFVEDMARAAAGALRRTSRSDRSASRLPARRASITTRVCPDRFTAAKRRVHPDGGPVMAADGHSGSPGTVHVIVTCTNRKSQPVPDQCHLGSVPAGDTDERARDWIRRLSDCSYLRRLRRGTFTPENTGQSPAACRTSQVEGGYGCGPARPATA